MAVRCVMVLIRGLGGLYPCPVCLVPKEVLKELWQKYKLRTGQEALNIVAKSREQTTRKDAEKVLKSWSLRPVDVSSYYSITTQL